MSTVENLPRKCNESTMGRLAYGDSGHRDSQVHTC